MAAIQPSSGGAQDAVILKLTSNLSSVIFSSYYGGSGDDAAFVTAINPITGNLYVGGATTSANLSGNAINTISPTFVGEIDIIALKGKTIIAVEVKARKNSVQKNGFLIAEVVGENS